MKRVEIKQALQMQASDNEITVMGWVRNKRGSKNVAFIALNDGSTINNLQLVVDLNVIPEEKLALMHAGASLWAKGVLVASMGSGQAVELSVKEIGLFGPANPDAKNAKSASSAKRHIRNFFPTAATRAASEYSSTAFIIR